MIFPQNTAFITRNFRQAPRPPFRTTMTTSLLLKHTVFLPPSILHTMSTLCFYNSRNFRQTQSCHSLSQLGPKPLLNIPASTAFPSHNNEDIWAFATVGIYDKHHDTSHTALSAAQFSRSEFPTNLPSMLIRCCVT